MRRLWTVFAAAALLAACSSNDTSNSTGSGNAAGGPNGGFGTAAVGTSALGAGGAGAEAGGMLAPGVPDRVLFDTNKSQLTPQDRSILDAQAAWLARNRTVTVLVAGNTDERGTEEYNLALGQRRANAARDYLVSKGIPGSRIRTISYGKDRPVAMGSTPADWAQNRNAITSVSH
jgi:peptidoglycan-associated lipoprotein